MTDIIIDPCLEPLVSSTAFLPLPSPLPLDAITTKFLSSHQPILKRSFTLSDLSDQADPIDFCLSFGCYQLLEEYTRTTLVTLSPQTKLISRIFHLWTYRIVSLIALNLIPIAAREVHNLNLVSHPYTPSSLRLTCASLHSLVGNPLLALQELHGIITIYHGNINPSLDHDHDHHNSDTPTTTIPLLIMGAYRDMISITAWSLLDPRLLDHIISQALSSSSLSSLSPIMRQAWWAHVTLAYITVLQFSHAEWSINQFESEVGSGASLVQFVRACLLSYTNQHQLASSAWSSLTSQVCSTATRIRIYESNHPGSVDNANLSDQIPMNLFPTCDTLSSSIIITSTIYANDISWIIPLMPVIHSLANNKLVAKVYAYEINNYVKDKDNLSSGLPTETDWINVVKSVLYSDSAMVSNLSTWLEVAPIGDINSTGLNHDQVSVLDRKRAILRDMIKETDAGAINSLRLG